MSLPLELEVSSSGSKTSRLTPSSEVLLQSWGSRKTGVK